MIVRKRKKPRVLQKIDALIPRLHVNHPALPALHTEATKRQAGYNGEKRLDYYSTYLPDSYAVLADVTLDVVGIGVQFDSIIISNQAIYLIEVKNLFGKVTFDTDLNQCIRDNGEVLEGFDDPLTQTRNAELLLRKWLSQRQLEGLPIYSFIAFANAKTIIKVVGETKIRNITNVSSIPDKIMTIDKRMPKRNQNLKGKTISKILQACKDFDFDILDKYNIPKTDIQPGVTCPICTTLTMKWVQKIWRCEKCNYKSENSHFHAMQAYQLLINNEITNAECRRFLQLNSRFTARRLLQNAGYQLGNNKKSWISKK